MSSAVWLVILLFIVFFLSDFHYFHVKSQVGFGVERAAAERKILDGMDETREQVKVLVSGTYFLFISIHLLLN